ncbi:NAC domain containing protein 50 [Prunus dulcis]|uniref:NAC domain containing protein 50 n=1 Tax=Prunus dulcis TaxID=3755 RepID=A0A5H2XKD2_PRUDU|nr:NAC domain containing protein 50 [Prunus dulcis]
MFAWSPSDMPGIDPNIICHRLHVNPACKPVAQKRRNFAPERVAIIEAEIEKLLAAGFIERSPTQMACQRCSGGKTRKGQVESLRRLHRPQQACPKTTSHCRESTNSWIPLLAISCSASWTPTPAITKS